MPGSDLIQSVIRGLEMLEVIAASRSGLSLGEIADELNVKSSTVFNLARTLSAKGYLEKTSRPVKYKIGPAVHDLYQLSQDRKWLKQAEKVVRALFEELSGTVVLLGEIPGGDFSILFRIDPARPATLERYPKRLINPYATAVSLAMFSVMAESDRSVYESRYPFSEYGQNIWKNREEYESFLREASKKGYVEIDFNEPYRVAAPVINANGSLVAAIGISFSNGSRPAKSNRKTVISKVTQSAAALSDISSKG